MACPAASGGPRRQRSGRYRRRRLPGSWGDLRSRAATGSETHVTLSFESALLDNTVGDRIHERRQVTSHYPLRAHPGFAYAYVQQAEGIEPLKPWFDRVEQAYLIGESEAAFAKTLKGAAETVKCGTLEAATQAAFDAAKASDDPHPIVLLSPACASFDMYTGFVARGEAFRAAVDALEVAS